MVTWKLGTCLLGRPHWIAGRWQTSVGTESWFLEGQVSRPTVERLPLYTRMQELLITDTQGAKSLQGHWKTSIYLFIYLNLNTKVPGGNKCKVTVIGLRNRAALSNWNNWNTRTEGGTANLTIHRRPSSSGSLPPGWRPWACQLSVHSAVKSKCLLACSPAQQNAILFTHIPIYFAFDETLVFTKVWNCDSCQRKWGGSTPVIMCKSTPSRGGRSAPTSYFTKLHYGCAKNSTLN